MAPIMKTRKKPSKASLAILLKQKNKDEAESIVAELKRISQQPKNYADATSNLTGNPSVSEIVNPSNTATADPGNPISMAPIKKKGKKPAKASQASLRKQKNKEHQAPIKKKGEKPAKAADVISNLTGNPSVSEIVNPPDMAAADPGNPISMAPKKAKETTKNIRLQDADMISTADAVSKTDNPSEIIDLTATVTPTSTAAVVEKKFVYEIHCESVAQSVSVADLQKYLQEQVKVGGEKDNCGHTVQICCRDFIVEIRSKTYLQKRYLRFLCKKFLKRNGTIRVVSNGIRSYELKHCGAP